MRARDWAVFLESHYRPHLLVVKLGAPSDSTSGKKLIDRLRRLTESLPSGADYAMLLESEEVKVALERDEDAETLQELLMASVINPGGDEWASKSDCDFTSTPKYK
jgi:hypothetical protein